MHQRINFVDLLPKRSKVVLSAKLLSQFCLLFIIGLAIAYFLAYREVAKFSSNLDQARAQEQDASKDLQKLVSHLAEKEGKADLDKKEERLQSVLEDQEKILAILQEQKMKSKQQFSSIMQGLSEDIMSGVWLRQIGIEDGGRVIQLSGFGRSGDLVLSQLDHLNQATNFKSWHFKLSTLQQVEQNIGQNNESVIAFDLKGEST